MLLQMGPLLHLGPVITLVPSTRLLGPMTERFSFDLEMKTREQNRNNKRREIERFDLFIKRIQKRVAFGWLTNAWVKKRHA